VIDCVGIHTAPMAFSSVSVEYALTQLLPLSAVRLTL
jgi:hypothetical protein